MVKLTETLVLARSRASDLDNVRKLNCWGSDISNVSILRRLTNVQIVSLSVNKITTLEDFSYCKNLEELYIRKNEIGNLSELHYLKKLPKLTKLWLADNPCAEGEKYRLTVLKTLPNLAKLDNIAVTEDELNQAVDEGLDIEPPESSITTQTAPAGVLAEDKPPDKTSDDVVCTNGVKEGEKNEDVKVDQSTDVGACGDSDLKPRLSASDPEKSSSSSPTQLPSPALTSWDETNKIRQQLGLKPLPVEKVTQLKPRSSYSAKDRNANLLQAALCLVKELDADSLEIVADAVRNRLELL